MIVTAIYSDPEGWVHTKTFHTEVGALTWLNEEGIDLEKPKMVNASGWNPSPMLIKGPQHEIQYFPGFHY